MFDVWKNVLAELEQHGDISHDFYTVFLKETSLSSVDDGNVVIHTSSIFKQLQIKKKLEIIREALEHNDIKVNTICCEVASSAVVKRKKPHEVILDEPKTKPNTIKASEIKTSKPANFNSGLNPSYTLDNFVIGSNNDLAVAVAKNIIEKPGGRYNPFFLYGGPGLGKTHLVQAIGNTLLSKNPKLKVLYMPVNTFYSKFISAIKKGDGESFPKQFKTVDVLIIDDFQSIIGKDASQQEFFNIFNELYQANKQIIVTSDRLPDQIKTVDPRLASRLTWAGPIDLQMPNFEDRCAILKSKAEFMGIEIEDEAIEYLAQNVKSNIRDLEGEFNKLTTIADLRGTTPLEIISNGYIGTDSPIRKRVTSARRIVDVVAKYYNLTVDEMCGKSRVSHIMIARQVAMYLLYEELGLSYPRTALEVGVKDHSTVMHGVKKIRKQLAEDFTLREQVASIREAIYD